MNVQHLDQLIAALEAAPDEKFNISGYFSQYGGSQHDCKTAACVAGWAIWVSGLTEKDLDLGRWAGSYAQEWLGLSLAQSEDLFVPDNYDDSPLYPRTRAIATLKRLRKTGRVSWGRAPKVAA